ncbi:DUF389 domain-containing protein [Nonlabens ponticola]|uniref:DUF389 domain-containing protein n=1 Tax=Nonlabens ponticola TaxID=2496866 RepID=A0A3S9MZY6_9FLAO|nr:DUF389 domain-containing protein [Nonlabens ponticola]AZQ44730.1 DUF389 domain-containing protein [Nonlabens ponticola]
MIEEEKKEEQSMEENQKAILGIWDNAKDFMHNLLDIREDSDRNETIESVRKDISFQGHNAWILIFSIFVASIGLNVSSTAVVIGAMLISPLMGPIVGMGLGTAINDERMLRRSLINLGVMVGLSLITATLYFALTPISEYTSELQARTYPTILDVLVAIFGGLALIVAKAKKGTISNAIAGVAIATALMPPLCTAGYGIAEWNIAIFGGAMYLFSINTVFIGLSTFVVCKLLRFPMVKYANQKHRKKVSRIATAVGIVVLLPSVWLFYQLYQQQIQKALVAEYLEENIDYAGVRATSEWNPAANTLDIILFGAPVPDLVIAQWKEKFNKIEKLQGITCNFYQGTRPASFDNTNNEDITLLQEERINDIKLLQDRDTRIIALEREITNLQAASRGFTTIKEELKLLYPELKSISFSPSLISDLETTRIDTVDVFTVVYKYDVATDKQKAQINERLKSWLTYRMKSDSLQIRELESKPAAN